MERTKEFTNIMSKIFISIFLHLYIGGNIINQKYFIETQKTVFSMEYGTDSFRDSFLYLYHAKKNLKLFTKIGVLVYCA